MSNKHPPIWEPPALDHDAMMLQRFNHQVIPAGRLERRIVANLIARIEANGFEVRSVFDGERYERATDTKAAMELIFNLDHAKLIVRKPKCPEHWIYLVLGNGIDIISDWSYTTNDPDGFNTVMDEFDVEEFA
jgi:hypothetical protein